MSDTAKSDLGLWSLNAMRAVELAAWQRATQTILRAEQLHAKAELTPERAQEILVSLLEQRGVIEHLRAQIGAGVRAAQRIANRQSDDAAPPGTGTNRFFPRTRVPPKEAAS